MNYDNIREKFNEDKVISISINNFLERLGSKIKKVEMEQKDV